MALFKISKGVSANLPAISASRDGYCYFTTDDSLFYIDWDKNGTLTRTAINANDAKTVKGKAPTDTLSNSSAYIPTTKLLYEVQQDLESELATTNSKFANYLLLTGGTVNTLTVSGALNANASSATKLTTSAGSATKPVYFSDGKPVECGGSLGVNITGNANSATTAEQATLAGTANKLSVNGGALTTPVYFVNGVPTACSIYTKGTKAFGIVPSVSSDGVMEIGKYIDFHATTNGSEDYSVRLSANAGELICSDKFTTATFAATGNATIGGTLNVTGTITGNLNGIASNATSADQATKAGKLSNTTAIGSSTLPVYFSANGVPVECGTSLAVSITGNAATATALGTNAGSATKPVYFSGGKPVECGTSLAVSITGSANSATTADQATKAGKLSNTTAIGSSQLPVYFNGSGVPVACGTSLAVSITGNAATATTATTATTAGTATTATSATTATTATNATNIYSSASTAKAYVLGTTTASSANHATVYNASVYTSGSVLYGAAWNDYAEYRISECNEPGRVICENGDDTLSLANERLQPGASVISDTFGFAIGETEEAKTPIAVSGRVLVYTYENRDSYAPGDAVCAAPNGTVSKMSREEIREYPERIVGVVSAIPNYKNWGAGNIEVNDRIWIKVK